MKTHRVDTIDYEVRSLMDIDIIHLPIFKSNSCKID
jgi:hypothetical protein